MTKLNRIIFLTSLIFLCIWIVFPIVRLIIGLEFASYDLKMAYKEFLFFAIPVLILLTLFGTLKKKDNLKELLGKTIGTIIGAGLIMFLMVMSIFTDMCNWSNEKILFENKSGSQKIITRNYGCGAYDSGPPTIEIHKVNYFSKLFIHYSEIDTSKIDKEIWNKIEQ